MATLAELNSINSDSGLTLKVQQACEIKAYNLLNLATPTTEQKTMANNILSDSTSITKKVLKYVLAANAGATVVQIQGATDTAIQTQVDAAIDLLVGV